MTSPSSPQLSPSRVVVILFTALAAAFVWGSLPILFSRGGMFVSIGRLYWLGTVVLPLTLLLLSPVMLSGFRRSGRRGWLGLATGFVGAGAFLLFVRVWTNVIEPGMLLVREVTLETPKLRREVRLLHISDIQSGRMGEHEQRAFALMRDLRPDLVLHTGDLLQPYPGVDHNGEWHQLVALWETLTPPLGKFNVVGDVDWRWRKQLSDPSSPIRTLEGEEAVIALPEGAGTIRILGLPLDQTHDQWAALRPVREWFRATAADDFTIVMGHGPDFVASAENLPIDLCLAGHTHGGQIRIPFFGPLITFSTLPREFARDFHVYGSTHLNVSAGIGGEHSGGIPTIRLNCPSEMTLIRLVPAGS